MDRAVIVVLVVIIIIIAIVMTEGDRGDADPDDGGAAVGRAQGTACRRGGVRVHRGRARRARREPRDRMADRRVR